MIWTKSTMQRSGTYHGVPETLINLHFLHSLEGTCGIVKHFLLKDGHSVWDFELIGIIQLENPPKFILENPSNS